MNRLTIFGVALASLTIGSAAFAQTQTDKPYNFSQPVPSDTKQPYSFSQPYIGGGGSAQPSQYQKDNQANSNQPADQSTQKKSQ